MFYQAAQGSGGHEASAALPPHASYKHDIKQKQL